MHAYLLVGQEISNIKYQISNLATKLKAKVIDFPIVKIEDTRNLNNLIRLSFKEPTLIVCENIHEAGEEALNAFLKNLEEPQENIYFALTTPSIRKVLPTIISRCEIVKIRSTNIEIRNNDEIQKFINGNTGEKLKYIDKIKDRDKAIEFVANAIAFLHGQVHNDNVQYNVIAKDIEVAQKTLTRLKANGNVNLQLTNMVIQMSKVKSQN